MAGADGPSPRGGAYAYDWIENLLGLNMHSADQVLPQFQRPQLGDAIGYGSNRMRVELIDPERAFAWRSEDGNWVWSFVLREDHGVTRLISRNRFRLPTLMARLGMLLMEPASLVMERKMLLGIKQRAESLAATGGAHRQAARQPEPALTLSSEFVAGSLHSSSCVALADCLASVLLAPLVDDSLDVKRHQHQRRTSDSFPVRFPDLLVDVRDEPADFRLRASARDCLECVVCLLA